MISRKKNQKTQKFTLVKAIEKSSLKKNVPRIITVGDWAKLMVKEDGHAELLWTVIQKIEKGVYTGMLVECPKKIKTFRLGYWYEFSHHHIFEHKEDEPLPY